eukprot:Plantae.Rhodophyta-Purpureofilum_apyrenoidigerum.ctg4897.p1 GENE.Plantae.Rhodophyta-Purpureofilum_apyrenoidigerum.ctg4897~~Plantae.Rhodophyta-Purpureofilum_apyrenoidigerum.ctg4897.p1  ORF type:complete len:314 (-),score=49.83 Plantae.Rhodophyta-Purpureofilum_apyrenoidigerum.ctg4897:718-1566(-)
MAAHCMEKGFRKMTAYNRTQSKMERLVQMGAAAAETPEEVARNSDVVVTMLGYPRDVREVVLNGVLPHIREGGVIVDMTTSEPALAEEIAKAAEKKGCQALDAPVTGGDVGAKNGTLAVLVGGDAGALDRVRPILNCFAKSVTHLGPAGAGQHAKMANQITICTNMIGMCEGLIYAQAAGLDLEVLFDAISGGAAGSFSLSTYAPRILRGDLQPGFLTEHFVKDLGVAVKEADRMQIKLPGLEMAERLYKGLVDSGDGRLGTQALIRQIERINDDRVVVSKK